MRTGAVLAGLLITSVAAEASANERRFSYIYESGVLPAGARELEIWSTARLGREERYTRFDERVEFEFGLTERLMTAVYLNFTSLSQMGPGRELQESFSFGGVSSEWKLKLSDPVADAIGSGVYGEVTFGPHEAEVEAKVLFDRKLGNVLLAANLVGETEWEFEPGETKTEYKLEVVGGASYLLGDHLGLGIEARIPTVFEEHVEAGGKVEREPLTALYAGPVVSWAEHGWWATLTVMPQLAGLVREEDAEGSLELDENEKVNVRLLFSFHL